MKRPAFVQSVFDFAIREINALEGRIVQAEDDADAMLWDQAGQVVTQIEAGLAGRELARQWINARTGKPYDERHVRFVRLVVARGAELTPRPPFRELYNQIANNPSNRLAHYSGDYEWYTPPDVIEAARTVLGAIDLDPASSAAANAIVQAAQFYTSDDDGLAQPWHGRVWLNPPYVNALVTQFTEKLATSVRDGNVTAAIAIVNNATETQWFRTLQDLAAAVCLPTGRVRFWKPDQATDSPLQGQVLVYVGPNVERFRECFGAFGPVWLRMAGRDEETSNAALR